MFKFFKYKFFHLLPYQHIVLKAYKNNHGYTINFECNSDIYKFLISQKREIEKELGTDLIWKKGGWYYEISTNINGNVKNKIVDAARRLENNYRSQGIFEIGVGEKLPKRAEIIDIINAFIIAVILRKKESVFADEGWALAINCISLLFIVGILLYTRFTKKDIRNIEVSKKHLPIYIIGLLAVSLYLTSLLAVLTGYEVILAQRYMIITLFISSFVKFLI